MASTYLSLHFHVVFSTKNLTPLISEEWRPRFHDYIGGTINGLGGFSEGVGGVADHVHLLFGLKATHCVADFMRELKKSSNSWTHDVPKLDSFGWQDGYAAFTVSPTARKAVAKYFANQEKHHRKKTFREELIDLLQLAEVEFDEQYLD